MATCRHIVNSALRKIGRLAAGREPRVADQTDVLAALQGLYGSWIASGAIGRLHDIVPTGTVFTASGNQRIYRASSETLTVELPELISSEHRDDYGRTRTGYYGTTITITQTGATVTVDVQASQPVGCIEPPRDGAPVIVTDDNNGISAAWLYDGTTKRWDRVDSLQLDNEAPRSAADPEGLAATLAAEIADDFGADVGPATLRQINRYQAALTHRYGMRREQAVGMYF